MAQFYTKERSVSGASPKIFDDSQRILKESEELIENMRAVSRFKEQQQAALVNNLRAQRQRDKELNTRNHEMLMDNMRQVAEITNESEIEKARQDNLKNQERAEQEQRTMQALSTISKAAGEFAGAMVTEELEKERKRAQQEAAIVDGILPQVNDGKAYALQTQLSSDDERQIANNTVASLAKNQGQPRSIWSRLFISEDRLARIRQEAFVGERAKQLARGGLEDWIRQKPDLTVTYKNPYTGEKVTRTFADIKEKGFQSSEELNRAYTAIADSILLPMIGEADSLLFHDSREKVRNYINTRTLQFSDKLTRDSIKEADNVAISKLLLADTPQVLAQDSLMFIDIAFTDPNKDRGAAMNQVVNEVLPNVDSPVLFAEELGKLEFRHMPGTKIADTPFGKQLIKEAKNIQRAKDKRVLDDAKQRGTDIGLDIFKASFQDNQLFDTTEYTRGYDAIREKEANGTISFETARQAELTLDRYYKDYENSDLVKANLEEAAGNQELTQDVVDQAFASGHIDRTTHENYSEEIAELSKVKLPNGLQYSQKSIRAQAFHIASDKVTRFDVSGQAKNFTANAAADIAADMYLQKYEQYLDELTPGAAAKQAWADVQAAMLDETGVFFVDRKDSQRGNVYSRLSTGTHTGAMKGTAAPLMSASEFGQSLRGNGISQLDADVSMDIDRNLAVYSARIKSDLPLRPTQYDQEAADAAGISFTELINRRFKALGIDAEAKEGSMDVVRKEVKDNPELTRVLNSPKTWNKLSSITDRSPNLFPARMGHQSLGFHNASSIARKLGHPNPEAIAALWYSQSGGGSNTSDESPMQQIQQIIKDNPDLNMFIPYGELANALPQVVPVLQQYGDSHNFISGTSKTIARLSNSMGPQDMQTGFKYLQHQLGFTPQGAAYLVGNIQQESSWNGTRSWGEVLGDGSQKNSGLISWAEFKGNRRRVKQIEDYLGKPIEKASHTEQLNAIKWELETYYPNEYKVFTDPNASDQQLKSASKKYLRYGHEGDRFKFAKQLLNQ